MGAANSWRVPGWVGLGLTGRSAGVIMDCSGSVVLWLFPGLVRFCWVVRYLGVCLGVCVVGRGLGLRWGLRALWVMR